jgi:hypothetical protein
VSTASAELGLGSQFFDNHSTASAVGKGRDCWTTPSGPDPPRHLGLHRLAGRRAPLTGLAFPGVVGEFQIFNAIEIGHGKGFNVYREEVRWGGGIRLAFY